MLAYACFPFRVDRFQDTTSSSIQKELGGTGRAGTQTCQGFLSLYTVTLQWFQIHGLFIDDMPWSLSLSRGIYNCCRAVWGSWKGTLRFLNQVLCIGLSLLWSRLHSEDGGENIPGVSLSKETSVLTTTRDTILPPQPPLKVRQSTVEDQPIHTAQDIRLHLITHF